MKKSKYYLNLLKSLSKTFKYLIEGRLTLTNIKRWYQGNIRLLAYINNDLEDYKREQFYFRLTRVDSECMKLKSCARCGCELPGLQMIDKACDGNCYPYMMDESTWTIYKKIYELNMVKIESIALGRLLELES